MISLNLQPLYGGALEMLLPSVLTDASAFRQVPDHQEVFVSAHPHEWSDVSVIVELNQPFQGPEQDMADHVISDLTAGTYVLERSEWGEGCLLVEARTQVMKFDRPPLVDLTLLVGVRRVPEHGVDVQLVVNVPQGGGDLAVVREVFHAMFQSLKINDPSIFT